jgi:deoxyribodipyrimidine photo-lyase
MISKKRPASTPIVNAEEPQLITNKLAKPADHKLDFKTHKMHRVILWLRNDLRLHDNPVLHWAASQTVPDKCELQVLPVYCFDPRFYDYRVKKYDIQKCGLVRTRFNLESVQSLRRELEQVGSQLLVAHEKPEDFIAKLVDPKMKTTIVYQ